MKANMIRTILIALFCGILVFTGAMTSARSTKPIIREELKVMVDGVQERWYLEWETPPISVCGPENDDWETCPCYGFAFGEAGYLNLVRQKTGEKIERFSLTDLFTYEEGPLPGEGKAVLQRWKERKTDSNMDSGSPEFISLVKSRPPVQVMHLKDYDHDGRATEFVLQIGNEPCGKEMSVVVGISRSNSRLHVFASAKNPKEPLILQRWHWESLAKAKTSVKVVHWAYGDHGFDGEEEYELKADRGSIHAIKRVYEWDEKMDKRGRLIEHKEF
ncbi:MAG: hypothetical protein MUP30_08975 [Deltaproteobacteria bacterium]|nr:hypothetical protein [Deltaproteobacteria bacterium]